MLLLDRIGAAAVTPRGPELRRPLPPDREIHRCANPIYATASTPIARQPASRSLKKSIFRWRSVLCPAILIPAKLFATMTESDLNQIGLHEATHREARRLHPVPSAHVEALFALHPVVRWITRQLDLEREIACDDAVARPPKPHVPTPIARPAWCKPAEVSARPSPPRMLLIAALPSRRVELPLKNGRALQVSLLKGRCALDSIALIAAASLLAKTPLLVAFSPPRVLAQSTPPATAPFVEQRNAGTKEDRARGELYLQIGQMHRSKGDYPAAINAMEQAAALLPDDRGVMSPPALRCAGQLPEALRNYEQRHRSRSEQRPGAE